MLGAILGDVIGSPYEFGKNQRKNYNFQLFLPKSTFTDDSVMSFATADAILIGKDYGQLYRGYGRAFPHRGYGGMFQQWIMNSAMGPYNSFGNGSGMRVSPVGWAFDDFEEVLKQAELTALPTHNHPEGIKGAKAVAGSIYIARTGGTKDQIREFCTKLGYDMNRTYDQIKPTYDFDVTCQGSVPEAIIAFLESKDFEDCIRLSVSLGGDCDTQACMAGGIAEAFYGTDSIPNFMYKEIDNRLAGDLLDVLEAFRKKYVLK